MLTDKISTLKALTGPLQVERGTNMGDVIEAIQNQNVGCVLIMEHGRLVGIMTERDVLHRVVARDVSYSEPVEKFMTPDPETLTPADTVGDAVNVMNEKHFRHVPVVLEDGKAYGVVSIKDIIDMVAESFPEQVLNLPPRPHQKIETPEGG